MSAVAAPGPAVKGKGAFGVKYIGEPGSSYSQPSGSAADAYETASRQAGGQGTFGPIGSDGKPSQETPSQKPSVPSVDAPVIAPPKDGVPKTDIPKGEASKEAVETGARSARSPSGDAYATRDAVGAPASAASQANPAVPAVRPSGVSASAAAKEVSSKPEDRSRYSLWDGLTGPADIKDPRIKEADEALKEPETRASPGNSASPAATQAAPQAAAQAAPQSAPAGGSPFLVEPFAVKGSEGKLGEIFVRFEIDLARARQASPGEPASAAAPTAQATEAVPTAPPPVAAIPAVPAPVVPAAPTIVPSLDPETVAKNTVAELGRVAGFREAARSEEAMRDAVADRFSVRGWMPSDRIAAAMRLPGVAMLEIEPRAARPSYGAQAVTDILVGIRVPKGQDLGASGEYAAVLGRLQSEAGFELKKTIGYQEVPGGKDSVVVISGRIPVRSISRALALNGVVKIASSPDAGMPVPSTDEEKRRGFLSFVFARSPLLVAATLIVLLSPLSLGLFRFLQVLSPYKNN